MLMQMLPTIRSFGSPVNTPGSSVFVYICVACVYIVDEHEYELMLTGKGKVVGTLSTVTTWMSLK